MRASVGQAPFGGRNYPFAAEAPLRDFVLDAYVAATLPEGESRAVSAEIEPVDETAIDLRIAVGDADPAIYQFLYGDAQIANYPDGSILYEWPNAHPTIVLRLLTTSEAPDNFPGGSAKLHPRTLNILRTPLRSLTVGEGEDTVVAVGEIEFAEGFNAEATEATDGVEFDFTAGGGSGRYNNCDETPAILRINNRGPDRFGNLWIEDDVCVSWRVPAVVAGPIGEEVATPVEATLAGDDDCPVCCRCADYANVYKALKRIRENLLETANSLENVRDAHRNNVARWDAVRDCRLDNPVQLNVFAEAGFRTFFGLRFSNDDACCLIDAEIRVTQRLLRGGSPLAIGSFRWTNAFYRSRGGPELEAPLGGVPAILRFTVPTVDGGGGASLRFRGTYPTAIPGDALEVVASVHRVGASISLDGEPCGTTVATAPAWATSLWTPAGLSSGNVIGFAAAVTLLRA